MMALHTLNLMQSYKDIKKMNITSAQYVSDASTKNDKHSITFVVDEETWHVSNPSVGNRFYDEIMRQVESGELTTADAD